MKYTKPLVQTVFVFSDCAFKVSSLSGGSEGLGADDGEGNLEGLTDGGYSEW